MAPAVYLDDFHFADWRALYRIAQHPGFYYRALNDRNAWIAWRAARYVAKAVCAARVSYMRRVAKAVRLKGSGRLIGCVLLTDIGKPVAGQGELGFYIAVPYQRQGIATVALACFVDWCLRKYDVETITATVHPENIGSVKLQEKLGLQTVRTIAAGEGLYFGRHGEPEPRLVMRAARARIEEALRNLRQKGIYNRDIMVL